MSRRRHAGAVLLLALAAAPALGRDPLAGIPEPNLELLDETVARRLREERAAVAALVAAGDAADEGVGKALGRLGGLYYLHDFIDLARLSLAAAEELDPAEPRWPYLRARALELAGDRAAARAALLRSLSLDPDDPSARIRLGDVDFELGDLAAAEQSYRRALDLDPARPAAHYGLGRIAAARGEPASAIPSFERALALQPAATAINHQIGMAYRDLGDLESARRYLALNTGGRVQVLDPVVDALAAELEAASRAFAAGVQAMKAGRFEDAADLFLAAREERPQDHLVDYNLALAYLRSGRRELALEALAASVEKKPDFRNGHFNLGSLAAEDGRYSEAEAHFGRAHAIDPDDQAAHLEWATALSRTGQEARAAAELESLLTRAPQLTAAWLRLGAIRLGAGQEEAAARSFGRVLDGDASAEERAEAHAGLGRLAELAGDWQAAVEHFTAAVGQRPSAETRLALATGLGRAGRFAEAAEQFSRVIEARPEALEPHFGRAMALLLGERYPAARQALEGSLERHAGSVPLRHLYSRLLATAPDDEVRDGDRALALATEVFRASQTLEHAETVAMALAESGRFDEARDWQRRVVEEARRGAGPAALGAAERRLELYEHGEPCRAPWLGG